jgi:hypothetical protein
VELPPEDQRMGFFGQVSFLGLHSHPVASSATKRGYFMRTALLCQVVPDPPSDVDTSLPEPGGAVLTLRDRLEQHRADPACRGCHKLTDVPGLGFENFDGVGRWRTLDNGGPIDPSGELDEVPFDDFRGLALAMANHPEAMNCVAEKLYAYAVSHAPKVGEKGVLQRLQAVFAENGYDFLGLMRTIVMSEGFRRPAPFDASAEPEG